MPKKNGTETVSISIESDLLSILDYYANLEDINRSIAVRHAIKEWIANKAAKDPGFWSRLNYGINNNSNQKKIF